MKSILLYAGKVPENVVLSVVIPTYKRAKYLDDAINSIILQGCPKTLSYEVIVVNNDPEDDMCEIIEKYKNYPISFYKNEANYGQIGNVNQCVMLAKGRYIAYLHDDDLLLPNYFSVLAHYICSDKIYPCIITSYYTFFRAYKFDLKHKLLRAFYTYRHLYRRNIQNIQPDDYIYSFFDIYNAPTCGMVFHKQAVIDFGMFKDERGAAWDYYNLRLFHQTNAMYMLHTFVGARRMYSGMSNEQRVQSDFIQDKKLLIEELKSHPFVGRYAACIMNKRPLTQYIAFRIKTEWYKYSHNLDAQKLVPYAQYQKLRKMYQI